MDTPKRGLSVRITRSLIFIFAMLMLAGSVAARVDFVFIMDVTGSTGALLPQWQDQIDDIVATLQQRYPGCRFGLASHLDYPFSPYGGTGEYAYRLESSLRVDPQPFLTALNALNNGVGGDNPESQYEAIYQAIEGTGRDLNSDGDFWDTGEILPGDMGYQQANDVILFHFTYPPQFHNRDTEANYPYAGAAHVAGRVDAIAALTNPNRHVIYFGLITSKGFGGMQSGDGEDVPVDFSKDDDPMVELAELTHGAVLNVGGGLEGLMDAIDEALEIYANQTVAPTLTSWGLGVLLLMLVLSAIWILRRQRTAV